jgi:hypothetical protein
MMEYWSAGKMGYDKLGKWFIAKIPVSMESKRS